MPKREQLVCQYLENVDRAALEKYQALIREYIRYRNGVYALYRRGELYYVGLAKNLRTRLKQHLKDRHRDSWDRFSVYLTIGDRHLKEMESLLLRITHPTGNRVSGKFRRAENLQKRLKRDVRALYRRELDAMLGRWVVMAVGREEDAGKDESVELARYIDGPMRLKAEHKGRRFTARVRSDGTIRFQKMTCRSPSAAGKRALGRAVNGWSFWKFERAPGDWVRLSELRR